MLRVQPVMYCYRMPIPVYQPPYEDSCSHLEFITSDIARSLPGDQVV